DPAGSDLADGAVVRVGDVEVAGAVDPHASRIAETRGGARAVRAAPDARGAGQRCHDPGGGNLADGLVKAVGDVDAAGAVARHDERSVEARGGARAVHATRQAGGTGQRRYHSRNSDLADGVVALIGDVDVASAVDRH